MTQPLLSPQSDLSCFQFNNEEKTVINLSGFNLIRADKTSIGGCWARVFCGSCIREGGMQLTLEDTQTRRRETMRISYDYEQNLTADLKRIVKAFQKTPDQSGES